jgi:hypothetical protein
MKISIDERSEEAMNHLIEWRYEAKQQQFINTIPENERPSPEFVAMMADLMARAHGVDSHE